VTEYRLSGRADRDLLHIYLYGVEQFGARQAERYRLDLEDCFSMLVTYPRMGRQAPMLGDGVRRHEHGSHVVLYKEDRDHILILAVVHGSSMHGLEL
jgi:toxin ParE1/3/4